MLEFDLIAHLRKQKSWSLSTFGPGYSLARLIDHIKKELGEIAESNGSLEEWVDLILLAFDGAWRSGATPRAVAMTISDKLAINENREWPDWRTADKDKAMEHIR